MLGLVYIKLHILNYLIFLISYALLLLLSCFSHVQPHRRQPTRFPRPWDSPGKNTGVGCHFLFQCVKVKLLRRVWLLATPWIAAHQAPPPYSLGTNISFHFINVKEACKVSVIYMKQHSTEKCQDTNLSILASKVMFFWTSLISQTSIIVFWLLIQ